MQASQTAEQRSFEPASMSSSISLLMIEDSVADTRLLQEMLTEAQGMAVQMTLAKTLKDGLDQLQQASFDIVLLDLSLPDSNGVQSVSRVLATTTRVPIVVLTGNESEELGLSAVAAGAQDFLTKSQLNRSAAIRTIRFAIERFNALHRQQYETVRATGEKMKEELERAATSLDEAGQSTSGYHQDLGQFSAELNQGLESGDVANLIERLSSATLEMHRRSAQLEERLKASADTINTLSRDLEVTMLEAMTDALTGLYNRKGFDERLALAAAESLESGLPLSLLLIDIDHFKKFNDTWGHQVGDQVLRLVGKCLRMNVKGKDTAARYGGEELAIILPETQIANAVTLAEQIRQAIGSMNIVKKKTREAIGPVTVSIGAAEFLAKETPAEFIGRADYALYAAKEAGRNRVTQAGS